ncbi:MAG: hypothetical protein AB3A66_26635 [Nodularia sp. CChRGM 3473]
MPEEEVNFFEEDEDQEIEFESPISQNSELKKMALLDLLCKINT